MSPLSVLLNQVNYPSRQRVKDDVKALTEAYKSLLPKVSTFVQNNGTQVKLMALAGTIPIFFNSVQYNIPVELFIPLAYPSECPKLFVRPTPNMTVKSNHRHVDMQGCVYLPYLHEWKVSYHLKALVETASGVFSIEPPLFSKPSSSTPAASPASQLTMGTIVSPPARASPAPAPTPTPMPTPPGSSASSAAQPIQGYASSSSHIYAPSSGYLTGSILPSTPNAAPSPAALSTSAGTPVPDPLRRLNLQEEVAMKLQECIHKLLTKATAEMSAEMEVQHDLTASQRGAQESAKLLQEAIHSMEKGLEEVATKSAKLSAETAQIEHALQRSRPEDHVEALDDLSTQIIQLHAQHQAIDDAFYFLDKALNSSGKGSKVDLNSYLKDVRELASQQFLCKLHLKKIERVVAHATSASVGVGASVGGTGVQSMNYSNSRPGSNAHLMGLGSSAGGPIAALPMPAASSTNPPIATAVYNATYNVSLSNGRFGPPGTYTYNY